MGIAIRPRINPRPLKYPTPKWLAVAPSIPRRAK
jgi:hypothetical protein